MDLRNLFGGGIKQSVNKVGQNTFRSYLKVEDGDFGWETQAKVFALIGAVGSYWRIWQKTVPAQTLIRWGYGSPALPDNQGYLWFAAGLTTTSFDIGMLRIMQENYSGHLQLTVAELPDSSLHSTDYSTVAKATLVDRNQMIAFPEKTEFPRVGQDSRLVLMYRPDTLVAEDYAQFSIPITIIQ